jgi:hypothetical protein
MMKKVLLVLNYNKPRGMRPEAQDLTLQQKQRIAINFLHRFMDHIIIRPTMEHR